MPQDNEIKKFEDKQIAEFEKAYETIETLRRELEVSYRALALTHRELAIYQAACIDASAVARVRSALRLSPPDLAYGELDVPLAPRI